MNKCCVCEEQTESIRGVYDWDCIVNYLCKKCEKEWNKKIKDKINGELIFKNKKDFEIFVAYIQFKLGIENKYQKDNKYYSKTIRENREFLKSCGPQNVQEASK